MPSRFQTMKCAASELLTTSTAWMLLAYSWPMRWKIRSPPERSTRRSMPGYFASNALPMRSATGRSTAVYQMTLPSFFAARVSAGVTLLAAGRAARAVLHGSGSASAARVRARRTWRLPTLRGCMDVSGQWGTPLDGVPSTGYQRPAPLGRQGKPDGSAGSEALRRRGRDPELRAIRGLDHVIPRAAQEDVADDRALDGVGGRRTGRVVRDADLELADGHGDLHAGGQRRAAALDRSSRKRDVRRIERPAAEDVAAAEEARDELGARPVVHLLGSAELLDAPGVHDGDPVGGRHRLALVVRDVDAGVAVGVVQPA